MRGTKYVRAVERKKNILYIDANNLYGWAMRQSLPYNEKKIWLKC